MERRKFLLSLGATPVLLNTMPESLAKTMPEIITNAQMVNGEPIPNEMELDLLKSIHISWIGNSNTEKAIQRKYYRTALNSAQKSIPYLKYCMGRIMGQHQFAFITTQEYAIHCKDMIQNEFKKAQKGNKPLPIVSIHDALVDLRSLDWRVASMEIAQEMKVSIEQIFPYLKYSTYKIDNQQHIWSGISIHGQPCQLNEDLKYQMIVISFAEVTDSIARKVNQLL